MRNKLWKSLARCKGSEMVVENEKLWRHAKLANLKTKFAYYCVEHSTLAIFTFKLLITNYH